VKNKIEPKIIITKTIPKIETKTIGIKMDESFSD